MNLLNLVFDYDPIFIRGGINQCIKFLEFFLCPIGGIRFQFPFPCFFIKIFPTFKEESWCFHTQTHYHLSCCSVQVI